LVFIYRYQIKTNLFFYKEENEYMKNISVRQDKYNNKHREREKKKKIASNLSATYST
jgi:hypothetical protein